MKEVFTSARFLLALLALVAIGVWVTLGKLGAEAGVGYLFALLTGVGVGAKFSKPRSGGGYSAMVLLPLGAVLGFSGCATWQRDTNKALDGAYAAAKSIQAVGRPLIDAKCQGIAHKCRESHDTACPALVRCQEERRTFNTAVLTVYRAVILGKIAVEAGNLDKATEWKVKVTEMLKQITALVQRIGG